MAPGAVLVLFVAGWAYTWIQMFTGDVPLPAHADPHTLAALTFDRLTRVEGRGVVSMTTEADRARAPLAVSDH